MLKTGHGIFNYLATLVLLTLVAAAFTWTTWVYFTQKVPGGNDFLAHYSVWQGYFRYGFDPYSDEAALYTQKLIYGRPALPGEDQNRLTYPFYSLIFHAPLVIFDFPLARAIYMTILTAALVAGFWLTLDLVKWRPENWLLGFLITWAILFYPQARGIILGQFAILGYLSLAGCLALLKLKRDFWAGAVLVASTVKPTLVFLVIPFLCIYCLIRARYKFLAGFGLTLAILTVGSFLLEPGWMGEWIERMAKYSAYTVGQSPVWVLSHQVFPVFGNTGQLALSVLVVLGLIYSWWEAFRKGGEMRFFWTLGITLVVSSLVVPRSATTNYVMLLVCVIWILAAISRSWLRGKIAVLGLLGFSFAGYWWLHFATVVGNQEQAVMFLPYPLAIGLVFILGRRWLLEDEKKYLGPI